MDAFERVSECAIHVHQQARPHLLVHICVHQLELLHCVLLVHLDYLPGHGALALLCRRLLAVNMR